MALALSSLSTSRNSRSPSPFFPAEIHPAQRRWGDRTFGNLIYWNGVDKDGRFVGDLPADKAAGTDIVRSMAHRAGAKIIEVEGSHLTMVSQPDAVAEVILDAARAAAAR